MLAPFAPRRDAHHGGARAIAELIAARVERHRIAVVHLRGFDEPAMDEELRARCELVREVVHPRLQGVHRWLRRGQVATALLRGTPLWVSWWGVETYARVVRETARTWRPDVVQLEYHLMGQYLPALGECPAPRVLVQHDPGVGAVHRGSWSGSPLHGVVAWLDRRAWRRYEARIMRGVDAVVVFTERDASLVGPLAGDTPVARIPLGGVVPERALSPGGADDRTLLFVGNFTHPPNVDAAEVLIDRILPRVRARHPDVRLQIVGGHAPASLAGRAVPGVELTGSVADVTPYLDAASLVVLPLRLGGGMRVKALEALAAGKAIVASPLAVAGLDLGDGPVCRLASSDEEFAQRIVELLEDGEARRRLGRAARAWALEHLTWTRTVDQYEALYRRLLSRASAVGEGSLQT